MLLRSINRLYVYKLEYTHIHLYVYFFPYVVVLRLQVPMHVGSSS